MQRLMMIVLFLMYAVSVAAEPALVQSGEHIGFTRLVTRVANEGGWSVEQKDGEITLRLEGYNEGFDTSQIFEFIPKDRVKRVLADQSTLTVYLGCDCSVSAFDVNGGYVALDIISSEQKIRPPPTKKSTSVKPEIVPNAVVQVSAPHETASRPQPRDALLQKELSVLSGVQLRLSQELGRATTRGVLTPSQKLPTLRRAQVDTGTFEYSTPIGPVRESTKRVPENIRITSSMDVRRKTNASQRTLSDQGLWCPSDNDTNVADWGDTREFNVQISEARMDLFGEFDRLNPDAVILLAKRYLYFGFGVEARQVLELDPGLANEQQLLMGLADIVDAGEATSDISIESFADCGGNISLWALLADTNNVTGNAIEPKIPLLMLNKLPVHLRQYLAPMVSDRFLLRNDPVSAAAALRSLERLPDALYPSATLAQAHIGLKTGHKTEGTKKLQDVAIANVAQSPEALISLVNNRIERGEVIAPETVGLVEAYAQELRGTDLGSDLDRAHVLALIETRDFDRALFEIEALGASKAADTRAILAQKLTKTASDIVFLDSFFRQAEKDLAGIDADTKILLGSRLLALGFASTAHEIVETIPERPRKVERQMLAAQIALALDQPLQALAVLLDIDGEAADILRADAKSMTGAYEEAHALYLSADKQDAAVRSAWLASNWRDLTPPNTPIFGRVTELVGPILDPSAGQIGMLSRTAAALEESSTARETITEFLSTSELGAKNY